MEDIFSFIPDKEGKTKNEIQMISLKDNKFSVTLRPVRQIPVEDDCFENIWSGYRKNKNIY
jgi:hypothetical protein